MYSANEIANWFVHKGIEENNPVTQMKLQKMLFFAHGLSLALKEKPLILQDFQAWRYGPVVPEIYPQYRNWGAAPITSESSAFQGHQSVEDLRIDPEIEEVLNITWKTTKDVDAGKLSNWTHLTESPWFKAYQQGENSTIENKDIKQYFREKFVRKN